MAAPIQNIEVNQGATFVMQITLKDKVTTTPIDIATYTFCGAVKQTTYDTEAFEFRFVIIDAVNGVVHAFLDPAVTQQIDFNAGVYDISFELVNGDKTRIMQGAVVVSLGGSGTC